MMPPTPKQVRYHYGRLRNLRYKFQCALNDAHHAGVIQYKDYQLESPCKPFGEVWERLHITTEKALAQAMREEIQNS